MAPSRSAGAERVPKHPPVELGTGMPRLKAVEPLPPPGPKDLVELDEWAGGKEQWVDQNKNYYTSYDTPEGLVFMPAESGEMTRFQRQIEAFVREHDLASGIRINSAVFERFLDTLFSDIKDEDLRRERRAKLERWVKSLVRLEAHSDSFEALLRPEGKETTLAERLKRADEARVREQLEKDRRRTGLA